MFVALAAGAQDAPAPAFVFVQSLSITDRAAFEKYQALARAAIAKYGGRFVARGAHVEFLEGSGDFARLGMIEFPNAAAAKAWFASPEFQAAPQVRRAAGEQRIF